jgi:hypothetical protein
LHQANSGGDQLIRHLTLTQSQSAQGPEGIRHILAVDSHLRLFLAPITDMPFPAPTADNLSVVAAYTWANRRNRRNPAEACNEDQRAGDGRHRSNVADTELRERPEHRRQIALTQILESQCPGILTI